MKLMQYLGFVSVQKVEDWDIKELRILARTKLSFFWLLLNCLKIIKEEINHERV